MLPITREAARIFRITHADNIPWILGNGLHCSSSDCSDPNFVRIGNEDLIRKRPSRGVPIEPGGNLCDYVPFYFTPRSPMLYNIKTGWNGVPMVPMRDIVVLTASLPRLAQEGVHFVFADRHAYLVAAQFSSDLADLDRIDWDILRRSDFARDPNDLGKMDRYQAEALVHQRLALNMLDGFVCCTDERTSDLRRRAGEAGVEINIETKREYFF